jgi:hypothetical protein
MSKEALKEIVEVIFSHISKEELKKETFEALEKSIKQFMYQIAETLFQETINYLSKEGFKENLKIKINSKVRKFKLKHTGTKEIISILGKVFVPYARYENRRQHKTKLLNHVQYSEKDLTSPNVKKIIAELAPFNIFEKVMKILYDVGNINISLSQIKDISNEIANENNKWIKKTVSEKNNKAIDFSLRKSSKRIAISNDGGRIQILKSTNKPGRKAKKEHEWKEVKLGIVYELDETGKKKDKTIYYGDIGKNWHEIEPYLIEACNRLGIHNAEKVVTLSDCGNGIMQMYFRRFGKPDYKIYFDIADFFHSCEYIWKIAKDMYPNNEIPDKASPPAEKWAHICKDILERFGGEGLLLFFENEKKSNMNFNKNYKVYTRYFINHVERMNYPTLIENNLPIGTGVMEAAIRVVNNKRFKQSNMFWKEENARNLLKLELTVLNNDFEHFWTWRNSNLNHWNQVKDMKFKKVA